MSENDNFWEKVLKGTILRLASKGEEESALKLLYCEISAELNDQNWGYDYYEIYLIAQTTDFDLIISKKELLKEIFNEVLQSTKNVCSSVGVCLPIPDLEDGWRDNLRSVLRGETVVNQGVLVSAAPYEYRGLYFRSKTEIKISEALDRTGVLYFPLPVACFKGRRREPDFLVRTPSGKWGILEVQGEPYHTPSRADQDHERARAFMHFGIPVQFYGSEKCYRQPDVVVGDFLRVVSAM